MIVDRDEENLKPGSAAADLYAHIGRIMVLWAEIEGYLFDLFVFATIMHKYKASVIFEKLGTIGPRLDLTNTLLEVTLRQPWLKKWQNVLKQIRELLPLRNHVAHSPTDKFTVLSNPGIGQMFNKAQPSTRVPVAVGFWYFSATDQRRISKSEHKLTNIGQLKAYLAQLQRLRNEISTLGIPRRARKKPPMPQLEPLALRFRLGRTTVQLRPTGQSKPSGKR